MHFAISSVLLHLCFNLKKCQEPSAYSRNEHNWHSSAMKGALMLETPLRIEVTLPELAEDRHAHAKVMSEA